MSQGKPKVVLTCGLDGSGKTTFARQMESGGFVRLSVDEEVWRRISSGELTPSADIRLVTLSIEEEIRARLIDLIRQGRDVVIDYSFPTRASRDAYRHLAEEQGAVVELVYFRLSPEAIHGRAQRGAAQGSPSVDRYIEDFEAPGDDEQPIVIDAYSGGVQ